VPFVRRPGRRPRQRLHVRSAHEPLGWRPTTLLVRVRRYKCTGSGGMDISKAAQPRAKISRRGLRRALEGIECQLLTVARGAEGLGVSWHTADSAILAEGKRVLIQDPARLANIAQPIAYREGQAKGP
jgi:hypothetical protein